MISSLFGTFSDCEFNLKSSFEKLLLNIELKDEKKEKLTSVLFKTNNNYMYNSNKIRFKKSYFIRIMDNITIEIGKLGKILIFILEDESSNISFNNINMHLKITYMNTTKIFDIRPNFNKVIRFSDIFSTSINKVNCVNDINNRKNKINHLLIYFTYHLQRFIKRHIDSLSKLDSLTIFSLYQKND